MRLPRVLITGLGATTPVGGSVEATWEALLAGRSGVQTLDEQWTRCVARAGALVEQLARAHPAGCTQWRKRGNGAGRSISSNAPLAVACFP